MMEIGTAVSGDRGTTMKHTARMTTAARLGRWLGGAWRGCLRAERQALLLAAVVVVTRMTRYAPEDDKAQLIEVP